MACLTSPFTGTHLMDATSELLANGVHSEATPQGDPHTDAPQRETAMRCGQLHP